MVFFQREKSGTEHWQVFMMIKYESRENGNDQKIKNVSKINTRHFAEMKVLAMRSY
jgi:hypothetical protein